MPLADEIGRKLAGSRFERIERRDHSWDFEFHGLELSVAQAWRLVRGDEIVVTDHEDGRTGDRDSPIDAEVLVQRLLEGRRVLAADADPVSTDLTISFEGNVRLDVLTLSTL